MEYCLFVAKQGDDMEHDMNMQRAATPAAPMAANDSVGVQALVKAIALGIISPEDPHR